jgi:hypothetical protein
MKIRQRIKYIDGVYMCYCSQHNEFSPCEKAFQKTNKDHGFAYSCKDCVKKLMQTRIDNTLEKPEDLKIANELLKKIGYNPEDKISVYSQFIQKHSL